MRSALSYLCGMRDSFANIKPRFPLLTKDRVGFYYDIEPKFLYPMFGDDIFTRFQNITTGAL